jgi:polyhydroxyalkanoate synthesis regulator phasin
MTDTIINNEPRTYTEEEVIELLRRIKTAEQAETQKAREERELPLGITSSLNKLTKQQHQDNFKRYKREVTKYRHDEWTVTEEINKAFIPKLKQYTVDTIQVVNAHYKGAEISRLHGRAATEIYEQLSIIQAGEISTEEAHQLLDETIESAKRLAVHAWIQGRQHDEDAKDYAIRALKLPTSLKHLETKEPGSKREAFSEEFITMYNETNYQQRVLRAATTNTSNGRGRGGYSTQ